MMVVVVDVDLVAVPLPVAAAVEIVRRDDPIRAVVKNHIPRAVIDRARDKYFPDVLVVAAGIVFAGNDAVVLLIPAAIVVARFLLFPAFVLTVVMPVVAFVLFLALVPAIVVMVVAVLRRNGQGQGAGQGAQRRPRNWLLQSASLCMGS